MPCFEHNHEGALELMDEAEELSSDRHISRAISILEHLLEYHADSVEEWRIRHWLGWCLAKENRDLEAITHLQLAGAAINKEHEPEVYLSIMHHLGGCLLGVGKHDDSRAAYEQCIPYLDIWSRAGDYEQCIWFVLNLGTSYLWCNNTERAMIEFRKGEDQYVASPELASNSELSTNLWYSIGTTLQVSGDQTNAAGYLEKVEPELLGKQDRKNYYICLLSLRVHQEEYSKALEAFDAFESIGIDKDERARIYDWVGKAYFALKRYTKANKYFQMSLEYDTAEEYVHKDARQCLRIIRRLRYRRIIRSTLYTLVALWVLAQLLLYYRQ